MQMTEKYFLKYSLPIYWQPKMFSSTIKTANQEGPKFANFRLLVFKITQISRQQKLFLRYFKTYLNHLILRKMSHNTGCICFISFSIWTECESIRVDGAYAKIVNGFPSLTNFTKISNSPCNSYSVNMCENTDQIISKRLLLKTQTFSY